VYDGGIRAVDKVNFDINQGEFVVLYGPSGCGKSTLLKMISGFEEITVGEVRVDGEFLNFIPPEKRPVAMVSQNYGSTAHDHKSVNSRERLNNGALSMDTSVYENMAYDLRNLKVPKAEIDDRINKAARMMDIEKFLERNGKALSYGQRWRVAFGRAFIRMPKIILLDDPLNEIDGQNHASTFRAMLMEDLSNMQREHNLTILYATCDQSDITTAYADRVIKMKDGIIQ